MHRLPSFERCRVSQFQWYQAGYFIFEDQQCKVALAIRTRNPCYERPALIRKCLARGFQPDRHLGESRNHVPRCQQVSRVINYQCTAGAPGRYHQHQTRGCAVIRRCVNFRKRPGRRQCERGKIWLRRRRDDGLLCDRGH